MSVICSPENNCNGKGCMSSQLTFSLQVSSKKEAFQSSGEAAFRTYRKK